MQCSKSFDNIIGAGEQCRRRTYIAVRTLRARLGTLAGQLRRLPDLGCHDRKRADRNDVAAMIAPAAIGQSAFDSALLAAGVGHYSRQSIGARRYRAPAPRPGRKPARDIIPAPGCNQSIPSGLEKSDRFHHSRNWNDEHIINGDDHACNTRNVAANLQGPTRSFILTKCSGAMDEATLRRKRQAPLFCGPRDSSFRSMIDRRPPLQAERPCCSTAARSTDQIEATAGAAWVDARLDRRPYCRPRKARICCRFGPSPTSCGSCPALRSWLFQYRPGR